MAEDSNNTITHEQSLNVIDSTQKLLVNYINERKEGLSAIGEKISKHSFEELVRDVYMNEKVASEMCEKYLDRVKEAQDDDQAHKASSPALWNSEDPAEMGAKFC